ncbi:MAG TPA: methionine--tRNA ligase subunit beta [Planctomycetota bacterium]|nr:methionine--tRNA ligase subunit beta [Planctomycetota bacterium]
MTDPAAPAPAPPPAPPPGPAKITIDDFRKLEFKTGKVLECVPHSNADKLFVMKVDVGGETRQIVSGIRAYYQPEELVGKTVVVVTNLQPAMLRGIESQGMVLAASGAGTVSLLTPVREVPPGSKVS